jgi:gliding motility-associated-like protein
VPPFTFSWTGGSTDSIASGLAPGTYYVAITDANGCVVNDSAVVGQDSPITITIDNFVQPTCNGGSDASIDITVAGGSGQYSFSWNGGSYITEDLSNIDAGLYTIVVTDNNGCTQTNQVQVNNPPPIPVNAGRDTSICVGSMVQLDADPLQAGQTGVWTGPGGVVFSDINDPHATASNMPAGYTILTWTVTDGATSCSQSDVVSVFGNNNSGGPDIDVCNLGPVTMNASMGTNFVGVWTGSSNVIINDPSMFNTQVNALGYAIEQLIWTVSSSACSNSDTVQVGFYQTPTADAGDSETVCTNKAELHALVTPPGTGVWSVGIPGQALFADSLNPITTAYDIDSVYTYFYWTMTNGICTATDAVLIHFDSDCELELPSGFSPNGDTYNDGYEIRGIEAYPHNVFRVFNRWGNEVYSKVNYQNTDWKGQNKKGDDLPEGTYYVILQITDKDITKNTYVDLRRYTGQK